MAFEINWCQSASMLFALYLATLAVLIFSIIFLRLTSGAMSVLRTLVTSIPFAYAACFAVNSVWKVGKIMLKYFFVTSTLVFFAVFVNFSALIPAFFAMIGTLLLLLPALAKQLLLFLEPPLPVPQSLDPVVEPIIVERRRGFRSWLKAKFQKQAPSSSPSFEDSSPLTEERQRRGRFGWRKNRNNDNSINQSRSTSRKINFRFWRRHQNTIVPDSMEPVASPQQSRVASLREVSLFLGFVVLAMACFVIGIPAIIIYAYSGHCLTGTIFALREIESIGIAVGAPMDVEVALGGFIQTYMDFLLKCGTCCYRMLTLCIECFNLRKLVIEVKTHLDIFVNEYQTMVVRAADADVVFLPNLFPKVSDGIKRSFCNLLGSRRRAIGISDNNTRRGSELGGSNASGVDHLRSESVSTVSASESLSMSRSGCPVQEKVSNPPMEQKSVSWLSCMLFVLFNIPVTGALCRIDFVKVAACVLATMYGLISSFLCTKTDDALVFSVSSVGFVTIMSFLFGHLMVTLVGMTVRSCKFVRSQADLACVHLQKGYGVWKNGRMYPLECTDEGIKYANTRFHTKFGMTANVSNLLAFTKAQKQELERLWVKCKAGMVTTFLLGCVLGLAFAAPASTLYNWVLSFRVSSPEAADIFTYGGCAITAMMMFKRMIQHTVKYILSKRNSATQRRDALLEAIGA